MTTKQNKKIELRCTEMEKNRIKWLADRYADGNVSLYMIYAALNMPRKKIFPNDMKGFSDRRKKERVKNSLQKKQKKVD